MDTVHLRNDELQEAIKDCVQLLEDCQSIPEYTREAMHEHLRDLLRVQLARATFVPLAKNHPYPVQPSWSGSLAEIGR